MSSWNDGRRGRADWSFPCPFCGATLDGHEQAKPGDVSVHLRRDIQPETGNLSLCLYCSGISVIDVSAFGVSLRRASVPEIEAAMREAGPELRWSLEIARRFQSLVKDERGEG